MFTVLEIEEGKWMTGFTQLDLFSSVSTKKNPTIILQITHMDTRKILNSYKK